MKFTYLTTFLGWIEAKISFDNFMLSQRSGLSLCILYKSSLNILQQAYMIIQFPDKGYYKCNDLLFWWTSIKNSYLLNSFSSTVHCSKVTLKKTNHDCITVVKLPWKSWRRSRPLLCDWCAQEFRFEHQYFLCVFILSVYVKLYFNFISAVLIIHEINIKL